MSKRLLITTVAAAAAAATLVATADTAQAQNACEIYTVKQGDSLGSIAQSAYGTFDYQQIFNANRNAIANPNAIEVGITLQLPCEDGSLPGGVSASAVIEQQQQIQAARATSNSFEPPIRLVTGNGWAPFTSEELKGGGMFTRIAATALNRGGNAREFSINFVDDWDSHFDTLLPLGAMDVSIAWAIPDCSNISLLSERMARRCTELDATIPVYESVFAFFTLPGNDYQSVARMEDLAGARICRPSGWLTFDLEQAGLDASMVSLSQPNGVEACLTEVINGEADVITLDIETIAAAAKEAGVEDQLVQNPNLTSLLGMRFVTHKTNPRGRVYIAMLNRGLTEMRESGEWYAIISDSLADFNAITN
ncbi:MAG: transporter substrate-binding domain-containing protein [Pseudomonadota bacterium]